VSDLEHERLVVVHGHLYQPPREDPWTGRVPVEPSAAPFHDWNERITAECYAPNTIAEVLDEHGTVVGSRNNYEHASFDVGPTLALWLERNAPAVHGAIVAADRAGHARHGYGPALAHPWVHAILPLATPGDRTTLVRWGVADFRARFGREPQGMWLPETAVDRPTLRALVAAGVQFTVLAPRQLSIVRDAEGIWSDVIEPGVPYRIALGSGTAIVALTYDGTLSSDVAFAGLLHDGTQFAQRLIEAAERSPAVVAAVTDFESYGHHHRFGEMSLAVALDRVANAPGMRLATAAEAALTIPPREAILAENTAWSCAHGIERWRSDCGCRVGDHGDQRWRTPLRQALDWLRDTVEQLPQLADSLADMAAARDDWVDVLIDVTAQPSFERTHVHGDAERAHRWLDLQTHLLMMYSSCAWFFDDAAGHETAIVLRHAARAIELVAALDGPDLEPGVVERLRPMRSNERPELVDGEAIWHALRIPA